jgi:hypothetical protein
MFYFGLDDEGLINSHIFDRKISTLRPAPVVAKSYPWFRVAWPTELAVPRPCPSYSTLADQILQSICVDEVSNFPPSDDNNETEIV